MLWSDRRDLTGKTVLERRERLEEIITPVDGIQVGGYVENRGKDLFELAKDKGVEGFIAKRKASIYRPGKRSPDWLKIKSRLQQEFVVCGFTEGKGSRKSFGALLLAAYRNGKVRYFGHSGTGFSERGMRETIERLFAFGALTRIGLLTRWQFVTSPLRFFSLISPITCRSHSSPKTEPLIMPESWKISGSYFEACNCEVACPCVFLSRPTSGECTVLLAWHIDQGRFGQIDLDGLNAALAAQAPGHMTEVKWKVALYVDERANQGQQDALTQIFSGQAGGHLAGLAPLIGEVLGVKTAQIEYRSEGKLRSLRLGDVAEMEIEGLPGQDGGDVTISGHPFTAVPGFPAVVAKSKQMRFTDYGLKWEVSNKNGFFSPFVYQSA